MHILYIHQNTRYATLCVRVCMHITHCDILLNCGKLYNGWVNSVTPVGTLYMSAYKYVYLTEQAENKDLQQQRACR